MAGGRRRRHRSITITPAAAPRCHAVAGFRGGFRGGWGAARQCTAPQAHDIDSGRPSGTGGGDHGRPPPPAAVPRFHPRADRAAAPPPHPTPTLTHGPARPHGHDGRLVVGVGGRLDGGGRGAARRACARAGARRGGGRPAGGPGRQHGGTLVGGRGVDTAQRREWDGKRDGSAGRMPHPDAAPRARRVPNRGPPHRARLQPPPSRGGRARRGRHCRARHPSAPMFRKRVGDYYLGRTLGEVCGAVASGERGGAPSRARPGNTPFPLPFSRARTPRSSTGAT